MRFYGCIHMYSTYTGCATLQGLLGCLALKLPLMVQRASPDILCHKAVHCNLSRGKFVIEGVTLLISPGSRR